MNYMRRSIARAMAGIVLLSAASTTIPAQATVDLENRYPNVVETIIAVPDPRHKLSN